MHKCEHCDSYFATKFTLGRHKVRKHPVYEDDDDAMDTANNEHDSDPDSNDDESEVSENDEEENSEENDTEGSDKENESEIMESEDADDDDADEEIPVLLSFLMNGAKSKVNAEQE